MALSLPCTVHLDFCPKNEFLQPQVLIVLFHNHLSIFCNLSRPGLKKLKRPLVLMHWTTKMNLKSSVFLLSFCKLALSFCLVFNLWQSFVTLYLFHKVKFSGPQIEPKRNDKVFKGCGLILLTQDNPSIVYILDMTFNLKSSILKTYRKPNRSTI